MKILRFDFLIPCLVLLPIIVLEGWFIWNAAGAIIDRFEFKPYPKPYQAKIVAINKRQGGKSSSYAPVVEVTRPNQLNFRFNSVRYSSFDFFTVGEPVELVSRPCLNIYREQAEEYEINSTYHLWLGDVLAALYFPALFIFAALFTRFNQASGNFRVWPVRRLQCNRKP